MDLRLSKESTRSPIWIFTAVMCKWLQYIASGVFNSAGARGRASLVPVSKHIWRPGAKTTVPRLGGWFRNKPGRRARSRNSVNLFRSVPNRCQRLATPYVPCVHLFAGCHEPRVVSGASHPGPPGGAASFASETRRPRCRLPPAVRRPVNAVELGFIAAELATPASGPGELIGVAECVTQSCCSCYQIQKLQPNLQTEFENSQST